MCVVQVALLLFATNLQGSKSKDVVDDADDYVCLVIVVVALLRFREIVHKRKAYDLIAICPFAHLTLVFAIHLAQ